MEKVYMERKNFHTKTYCVYSARCTHLLLLKCCFTSINLRLIRDGSPGQPPRLSHSSWALIHTAHDSSLSYTCMQTNWRWRLRKENDASGWVASLWGLDLSTYAWPRSNVSLRHFTGTISSWQGGWGRVGWGVGGGVILFCLFGVDSLLKLALFLRGEQKESPILPGDGFKQLNGH